MCMTQINKYMLLVATAISLFAGCADNTYLGDQEEAAKGSSGAISFEGGFKAVTRADKTGADAASQLGNRFIINGIKAKNDTPNDVRQTVFQDYTVNWIANTAGTTTTNSSDWEYTGINNAFADPTYEQTVKYWDWSQDYYNFAAYSVGKGNAMVLQKRPSNEIDDDMTDIAAPAANQIYVAPFEYQHITGWPYFLRGSREDLLECHITDMATVPQANFGDVVELKFRSLAAKVRVGFYETIRGFSIKDVRFYNSTGTTIDEELTGTVTDATLFGTGAFPDNGTYKILFPHVGSANVGDPDYNKAHAEHEAITAVNSQTFGTLDYTSQEHLEPAGNYYLGRSAAAATFAGNAEDDYYTKMLPFEEQSQTLELRVNYTLVSTDITGETITVYGAQAFIPSVFAKWKPNCAYTYIFKISDNQNGWTSTNLTTPRGLFPITFDAVYLNDENGEQTTITTVATPSITTYQKGHIYNVQEEYKLPTSSTTDDDDIYAQVVDVASGNVKTDLNGANKSLFYNVSKADATEAEVMDALNIRTSGNATTVVGVNGITLTPKTIDNNITTIPGVNGDITVNAGEAAKLTPDAAGTYAYVYDTGAYYPVSTVILSAAPADWPTNYYTNAEGTTPASGEFEAGTYYQKLKIFGVKVVKVKSEES